MFDCHCLSLTLSFSLITLQSVLDVVPLHPFDSVLNISAPAGPHTHTGGTYIAGRTAGSAQMCSDISCFPMRNDIV